MKAFGMVEYGHYEFSAGVIIAEDFDEAQKIAEEERMFDDDSIIRLEEIDLSQKGYTNLGSYIE